MRYQQPYGTPDNSPYINGNPAQGTQGSIPPAAAFEQPQRELVGVIEKSALTASDSDLLQLAKSIRSQRMNYAVDTGTANNLVVAFDPPFAPGTNPYTFGLTLHVRVRYTNVELAPGVNIVNINAGAGNARVRKMNGFDPNPGDIPQNAVVTLVYDGTAFQLSNFGGSSGDVTYEGVNIPFTVADPSPPQIIIANFSPPIPAFVPGTIFAVQVINTNPGETTMTIDFNTTIPLLPNGGGRMLQGDIVAGDVVQFFYDGQFLRFAPNPEINAPVIYSVGNPLGPSGQQQFDTIDAAMTALRRKIIGANGYVTLQLAPTGLLPILGPINVSHPSGDRLCIRGAMSQAPPVLSQMAANGSSAAERASDGATNLGYLLSRYGTVVTVPSDVANPSYGFQNNGSGRVLLQDMLFVVENNAPPPLGGDPLWWNRGIDIPVGGALRCDNVSVWGCQVGFNVNGALNATGCVVSACSHVGFAISLAMFSSGCGAFGCATHGYYGAFASINVDSDWARCNGENGFSADNSTGMFLWHARADGNGGADAYANVNSSIIIMSPDAVGTTNPPVGQANSLGAIIARGTGSRPP